MREKLKQAWINFGKFLLWALAILLCGWLTYMVFVHRKLIRAAIKGEPLPECKSGKFCPCFRKKK